MRETTLCRADTLYFGRVVNVDVQAASTLKRHEYVFRKMTQATNAPDIPKYRWPHLYNSHDQKSPLNRIADTYISRFVGGSERGVRRAEIWWSWVDLNHRPQHYECCALTS